MIIYFINTQPTSPISFSYDFLAIINVFFKTKRYSRQRKTNVRESRVKTPIKQIQNTIMVTSNEAIIHQHLNQTCKRLTEIKSVWLVIFEAGTAV